MSYGVAHSLQVIVDALRYLVWSLLTGFAILGAAYFGGASVYAVWQNAGETRGRQRAGERAEAAAVHREAVRGITELETFLAAQLPAPNDTDDEHGHHNAPPSPK